ncbi:hypothetical protein GDO86_013899 [Hymenochirus boettgeri]|uniref:Nuclear receptor coactivator 6 TRADD-N domain-containing protein n=1 Tax=Hymenochirus boettgeri TaxID=247094 RepID=A0A8T2JRN1_9PIPI|nr:hypothetical protein GDO86_013899 [Hymenochirus boettgeri]
MVSYHFHDPGEAQNSSLVPLVQDGDSDSGIEDEIKFNVADSTIFLAFKGDIGDSDFQKKLQRILQSVPNLISMESTELKLQKVEPWNSVRVTFNIPREAAERLRFLAQSNNQQLRDLGILSVQIEGEGAINLALSQNRSQEVRMNGPMAAGSAMRIDGSFAMQGGAGMIRMNTPAVSMMSQVSSAMMGAGGSNEIPPRTPRPHSQQDTIDPMATGLSAQQSNHPSGSLAQQIHPMQSMVSNRLVNPANFQQFQQQARLPQHAPVAQGIRQSFAGPSQVPVPPGWNQLASGALQPPPAQAALGSSSQGWKKSQISTGPLQQQQFPQRPSLASVQTPSHPPPPYPFGSQQATQAHTNFPSMANPNQFNAPSMKPMQGGSSRVPTPLQQPHLTSKSPTSSPSSSFQQSSPASSPTVNQIQQQPMGPRSGQATPLPQGFQQQPVSSPSRVGMISQGNATGFMMQQAQQQSQGPQAIHAGLPKRLPPGFQAGQGSTNFLQGQTLSSATGSPVNGAVLQQQGSTSGQAAGGPVNGSSHNQMQASHAGPNLMQNNLMGLHNNLNNQQSNTGGLNQVNMVGMHGQSQQANQSQLLGMHQPIISQGQMVNLQGQAPLNTQAQQMVLSRNQLLSQGQMLGSSPSQNLGPAPQRMTPPKQMLQSHGQMMAPQGQALMQQNAVMEQIMQANKPIFNTQNPAGVMAGPGQITRIQAAGLQNAMVQFSGQTVSQQGSVNNGAQGVNMQGQVLRAAVPGQHLQQTHGETSVQPGSDLGSLIPDIAMQQAGNMTSQHLQNIPGGAIPGHFAGHGLPFGSPFAQGNNGNQMGCGQNPSFPMNKDVTLTSPLLVNLLQSDISSGHFGVNNKQNNNTNAKPKKKKPPRKKKNQQTEEPMSVAEPRMEDSDQMGMGGEQGGTMESGQKLSEFPNRPTGYPPQPLEQRTLQQIPPQLMQLGQQQGQGSQTQQPTPPQQMMMMLMMQQQQQQEQKAGRLNVQQGVFNPRAALSSDTQRMPMQQGSNMPIMVNLQGAGSIPPSPDKQRMSMAPNSALGNNGRKMGFPESVQNQSGSPLGEGSSLPDGSDLSASTGQQNNMAPHMIISQNQLMMSGNKTGAPSSLSLSQGASPQQPHANPMSGPHGHHYQSVQTPSQTSRPKTPNRASPRPYYPQTPNNRPPSTEPSEISLSPERLNASIAGLFPPQINIPLPPRPTLNRGFDQQGLNPTTLKAIGQAPPGLSVNNPSGFVPSHMNKMDVVAGKQTGTGGNKRASPSNSRRSSPASSRKTTPSPGRQNLKTNKFTLGPQQNPSILHNLEMQRNALHAQASMQSLVSGPPVIQYPPAPLTASSGIIEEMKDSSTIIQETDNQVAQSSFKEQAIVHPELKMGPPDELSRKDAKTLDNCKPSSAEETKSMISPAMKDAPTSLSQLLDHSTPPNLTINSSGPITESPPLQLLSDDPKIVENPALQEDVPSREAASALNPNVYPHPVAAQTRPDNVGQNPPSSLNAPSTAMKRSTGQTTIPSSQSPITVFVTSNTITTPTSATAPMTSHQQQTLTTMANISNAGSKVIVSEGQQAAPSNSRSQFVTPVFFNSPSIIQVMKGSQQSSAPSSAISPSSDSVPPPVTAMGPLHVSPNIQFSPGTSTSASPSSAVSSINTTRPSIINPVQSTMPLAQTSSSPALLPPTQFKASKLVDARSQLASEESPPVPPQPMSSPSSAGKPGQLLTNSSTNMTVGGDPVGREIGDSAGEEKEADRTPPIANMAPSDSEGHSAPLPNAIGPEGSESTQAKPPQSALVSTVEQKGDITVDNVVSEQALETVSTESVRQDEAASHKQCVPVKAETDPQDIPESDSNERAKPLSRKNSKVEETQEVLEGGQRKRSARPTTTSASAKDPGASPTQPKRRKSK